MADLWYGHLELHQKIKINLCRRWIYTEGKIKLGILCRRWIYPEGMQQQINVHGVPDDEDVLMDEEGDQPPTPEDSKDLPEPEDPLHEEAPLLCS